MLIDQWKEKRRYIKQYDASAYIYNLRYREEQSKKYEMALKSLSMLYSDRILDVGCGTGLFILKISKFGKTIVGIDCSKKMLNEAKKKCSHLLNVSLICSDADFLPLRENSFNLVFAFTLLQNMPNPEKTLHEILRVANIDSTVILTAQKKAFTKFRFMQLLGKIDLYLIHFIATEELKDYLAICRRRRNQKK